MDNPPPPDPDDPLLFTPVPVVSRHDGWTGERQYAFVQALIIYGTVKHAAASVGKSRKSAYALRKRPGADGFARAWDAALDEGQMRALDIGMQIGVEGVEVPVFYQGRQVGTKRRYNNALLRASMGALDRKA
ncbi:MAG: hypothetical protein LC634_05215, partial [Sphingomonadales bacterium]|nr:hypothetical protein [Sphingomonadales bacterium]